MEGAGAPAAKAAKAAPAAKAAKPKAPGGPKKSLPKLEAGWSMDMGSPGPWMARSIQRWSLQAPYKTGLPDTTWEQYYKERATLEWYHNAFTVRWY